LGRIPILGLNWPKITEEEHKAYRNRLGNLAMLGSRMNSTLKDASFGEKKAVYKASDIKLTQMVAKKRNWTRNEIEDRQSYLAEKAVKVWPYKPKVL
jgi:hypothetical protein